MATKKIIYVGAKPDPEKHPGGQVTASLGILHYAESAGFELEIIDTARESFPKRSLLYRLYQSVIRMRALYRLLKQQKVDGVLIFSGGGFSFYEKCALILICRLYSAPSLLFVVSGHFMDECRRSGVLRTINRLLLRLPTWVGAQGRQWVTFLEALGVEDDRILLVRNWVSPGRERASAPKRLSGDSVLPTFLFVGWLVRKKGVLDLLEAVRSSSILQRCKVRLAGNGDLMACLQEEVKRSALRNFELLGWQTHEQIDQLMRGSDVFVLPTYAEGFPNSLVEALSHGMPVIVCPVGAIGDSAVDGSNALLVPPGDVAALRAAMETFANSPQLIERYSKKSLELVERNHDLEGNLSKLFQVFTSVNS